MARPKLTQIARMADTTASTVSKVLNGRPGVSAQTRRRIEDVLAQIGYSKRPVRHPGSNTIMIVCANLSQPWVPDLLKGALRFATAHGMTVAIAGRDMGDDVYIRAIERAHPVAVIFDDAYIPMEDRRVCERLHIIYAVLSFDGHPAQEVTEYRVDDWRTGFCAARYLLGLGHRRLAIVSGPLSVPCNQARVDGFRAAAGEARCPVPSRWVRDTPGWMESGRTAALALLSEPVPLRPTAIFSTSDTQALGILGAAHELGIAVPQGLSVLGCDGIEAGGQTDPPLTTFRHPAIEMVEDAFKAMVGLAGGPDSSVRASRSPAEAITGSGDVRTYETRLIPRGSCAAPAEPSTGR